MADDVNVKVPVRAPPRVHRALVLGAGRAAANTDAAARVASALGARGYRVESVDGPAATRAGVLVALGRVLRAAGDDDVLVVYASADGRMEGGRPHLALAGSGRGERGGLAVADLLARLRGGPRWIAVVLALGGLGVDLEPETVSAAADVDERDGGFAVLATGDRAGALGRQLADGLAGGAADPDGAVRFSALARHAQDALAGGVPLLRLEVADLPLAPPHAYQDVDPLAGGRVGSVAFAPDGRRLAIGADDGSVRVHDVATGAPLGEPWSHGAPVCALTWSADGRRVTSVATDGIVLTRVVARRRTDASAAPLAGSIHTVAWSPAGARVAAPYSAIELRGIADGERVDLADPRLRERVRTHSGVWLCGPRAARALVRRAHLPLTAAWLSETTLVTGGGDGALVRWDAAGRATPLARLPGPVWAIAVAPDRRALAAGGADRDPGPVVAHQPRVLRVAPRTTTILDGHRGPVAAIAFAADGARVATASHDGTARVFEAQRGQLLRALTVAVDGRLHHAQACALAWSPDGARLAVGYGDGRARVFVV
jgi:WD40 repeat protein